VLLPWNAILPRISSRICSTIGLDTRPPSTRLNTAARRPVPTSGSALLDC
jgi:hypothetical protein